MSSGFYLKNVFTGQQWLQNVSLHIDALGYITKILADNNPEQFRAIHGPVVPGVSNLHSHAFQYAMGGLTEIRNNPVDTFWSWRKMMYHFALRLTPEHQTAVAAKLYLECLKRGYTSVVEFHYIHNSPDGSPYAAPEQMSLAILEAADLTGIQLSLLPVFYAHANFGSVAPKQAQRRFVTSLDTFATILGKLGKPCAEQDVVLGVAAHSLRAVNKDEMRLLVRLHEGLSSNAPIHIHIAEQILEVDDALAYTGRRPVEMLFDLAEVNQRWCLIHATHMTSQETKMVAKSGATVGLCPVTEANLGDGIFNAVEYLKNGGNFGIGSDSNINCDPYTELQMLEYSQRLSLQQRTVLASEQFPNTGTNLLSKAAKGGAQAAGRKSGLIAPGFLADFYEIGGESTTMLNRLPRSSLLDYRIFTQNSCLKSDVVVGGKLIIDAGHHPMGEKINHAYNNAMKSLCQEIV